MISMNQQLLQRGREILGWTDEEIEVFFDEHGLDRLLDVIEGEEMDEERWEPQ
jgi:hypothetical protein